MFDTKEEAVHLLKKLVNACNLEVQNKELATDIIEYTLERLLKDEAHEQSN